MVTRNEAARYLQSVLRALSPWVDVMHVHDDRSDDDTVGLALAEGAACTRRDPDAASFATSEGVFRQDAWRAFEVACAPEPDDWVLAIDADELLVVEEAPPRYVAANAGAGSVVLPIPEVFRLDSDGTAHVRTDALWSGLRAPRLFVYQAGATFPAVPLACGSWPTYVSSRPQSTANEGIALAHLGYADRDDRLDKFRRYYNRPGHSAAHIASILTPPRLEPYRPLTAWRGVR
jgi:hypothetical protein